MPVTLRKRLACHYCGKRLNTTRRDTNKITCTSCLADNFLDADDNIVDVPATEANRSSSRAQAPEIESESTSFCKTCLTNQSFYVNALADYLPDDDDPRYPEFERALPEFKKDLDLRYPRCCAQCEPRVQATIQQANYAAKADHLRRLMHRKHGRRKLSDLHYRSFFISAAGAGHILSLALQLTWHALSSQPRADHIIPGISPRHCFQYWPVPAQCSDYAASLLPMSLALGFLCIWWNPKWQQRLSGKEGRFKGLRKYYMTQLLLMIIRFIAWTLITDLPSLQQYRPAIHTACLGLLTTISIYSWFGIIEIDNTPIVDWNRVQEPLTSPEQFQPPVQSIDSPPSSQIDSQFRFQNLAGTSQQSYAPWRPPTPPMDDGMDWTPAEHNFSPRPSQPRQRFEGPSPFHGTLPAAPVRGSLDPKRPVQATQKTALGLPPGFFGLSKRKDQPEQNPALRSTEKTFAPARFFAHEREADTGLENIFDRMFSVRDHLDPTPSSQADNTSEHLTENMFSNEIVRPRRISSPATYSVSSRPPVRMVISCTIIVALSVVVSSLGSLELMYGESRSAPSTILQYTSVVPAMHVLEHFIYENKVSTGRLILNLGEICFAASSAFFVPVDGSALVPLWNKLVIGTICFFLLQEIYHFCQLQSTPVTPAAAAQMLQSMEKAEQQHQSQFSDTYVTSATSHPSPQAYSLPPSQHSVLNSFQPPATPMFATSPPSQHQTPSQPFTGYSNSIRKRDSDESISSVSSIQTTSTAPGWKTPRNESRTFEWQYSNNKGSPRRPSANIARGLGGLSLGNDFGLGSGTGIAGPRTRSGQTPGNGFGRYR